MELKHSMQFPNIWTNKDGAPKFITSYDAESDTSLAWINRSTLTEWLRETNQTLILAVGGEKNIYEEERKGGYKRKNLNALCSLNGDTINIDRWEKTEGDLEL